MPNNVSINFQYDMKYDNKFMSRSYNVNKVMNVKFWKETN